MKAKNKIITPTSQIYGSGNVISDTTNHFLITKNSEGTGDFNAIVVGIVLTNPEGAEHVQVSGLAVATQPNFYPSSNPLGYVCLLQSEAGSNKVKHPRMEPFPDMPPPNSPTYLNHMRALFPKYFFKLRAGHTYEPVYIGSQVIVGYTNNEVGGPGHFIRSVDMVNSPAILRNMAGSVSSTGAYNNSTKQFTPNPDAELAKQSLVEEEVLMSIPE